MTTNKMKYAILIVAALAALVGDAGQARAGLLGATVNSTYYYPDLATVNEPDGTLVVAPTATFTAFGVLQEVVSDTQIVLTIVVGTSPFGFGTFNGPVFDFIGSGNLISGVTVDGSTTVGGFDASLVTLTTDGAGGQFMEVNLQSILFGASANITLDVSTVPEPASMILCGLGALGLFVAARRRRKA